MEFPGQPRPVPGPMVLGPGPQPFVPTGVAMVPPGLMPAPDMQHLPPEMMIQAVPMQVPGMIPLPPMIGQPMMGPMAMAPQLTQMLADAAKGGRSSNIFFKTRICNKWRSGNCPYGDKCTYAHGEHELRYIPPELVAQLEAKQRMEQPQQPPLGPPDSEGGTSPMREAAGSQLQQHRSYYKTRVCMRFMQTGYCNRGAACTFAHGMEELRNPSDPLPPQYYSQERMQHGTSPHSGSGSPYAMPVQLMSPTMYAPQQLTPSQQAAMEGSAAPGAAGRQPRRSGSGVAVGPQKDSPLGRARAMCAMTGVGPVGGPAGPGEMQAAMAAARSGAAYKESAYADSIADYVQPQQEMYSVQQ